MNIAVGGMPELERGDRHSGRVAFAGKDALRSVRPYGIRVAGGLQTQRPKLGLHDIEFIDGSEGADAGRALDVDLSPNARLVVAADREWIERINSTVIEVFGAAFAAAIFFGLAGAAVSRWLFAPPTAAHQPDSRGDHRRRHSARRMPVSERRDEFDELALDAQPDARPDRNAAGESAAGLERHRARPSDPLARLRTRLEQGSRTAGGGDPPAIIEDAIRRVDDVLSLFAAILRISEVESGQTRRFFGPVDLSLLTTELAESYAPAIQDEGALCCGRSRMDQESTVIAS